MNNIDSYQLIDDLPTGLDMRGKPIRIQKLYGAWFAQNKEKRIAELIKVVKSTKGYEDWCPDFTKESLVLLGQWLKENITSRKLTDKEYRIERNKFPDYIDILDWDLTYRSRSLLYDTGVYFGETFIHSYPILKWEQCLSRAKLYVDVGHMIIKVENDVMNPIQLLVVIGWGLADGSKNSNSLYNLFEIWSKYVPLHD